MKSAYDLVIIGSGPAGITAAIEAKKYYLHVAILGENYTPGGQFYRSIEKSSSEKSSILGKDYFEGKILIEKFRKANIDYFPGALVWQVERDLKVNFLLDGVSRQICGHRIMIATGARARPVPIAGWTLPGVMAASAIDILLKSSSLVPSGRFVLAGNGPFLFLIASRLIDLGIPIKAILETKSLFNYISALLFFPNSLRGYDFISKGLTMKRKIRESRTPIMKSKNIEAIGTDSLQIIRFVSNRKIKEIKLDTLFLHNGFVPETQISKQLGFEHRWNHIQRYWTPVLDKWGNSDINGICIVGDASGIAGVDAARIEASLAVLETVFRLNIISQKERDLKAKVLIKQLDRVKAVRLFLDRLFRPDKSLIVPKNKETVICRCEEITVGDIRNACKLGCLGPNHLKTQTRSGMGPCQGRMCNLSISEIIADCNKVDVSEVGFFTVRPPIKPITVGQLSNIQRC